MNVRNENIIRWGQFAESIRESEVLGVGGRRICETFSQRVGSYTHIDGHLLMYEYVA